MAKPKIVKGRGHVTAAQDDQASNSLPSVGAKKASPTASAPSGGGKLPAPSKPASKPSRVSGASRSTSGKVKAKPGAVSGASRSTRGKVSAKSGASRSTSGKVKAAAKAPTDSMSPRGRSQLNDFRQSENKKRSDYRGR